VFVAPLIAMLVTGGLGMFAVRRAQRSVHSEGRG